MGALPAVFEWGCFVFFFDKFYLYIKFIKNEVFYEKCKYGPFRRLYVD